MTGVQRLRAESGAYTISSSLYETGWNARRERSRMPTEQALTGVHLGSSPSNYNLQVGNLSSLPTICPLLRAKLSQPHSGQQRLNRNSLSITRTPLCSIRQSGFDDSKKLNMDLRNKLGTSRRISGDFSSFHSAHKSVVRRSRSCSFTTSYTSQELSPVSLSPVRLAQHSHAITSRNDTTAGNHVPVSGHAKLGSMSRMYSLPRIALDHRASYDDNDYNIHISSRARFERMAYVRSPRSQPGWHPTRAISSPDRSLVRHASYVDATDQSQQDAVRNAPQETFAISSSHSLGLSSNQRHSRSRSNPKASSPIRTPSPAYSANSWNDSIYKQNPDKVGHSPPLDTNPKKQSIPNRESLMKWKSEREEARAEFDGMQRAKIKERVRRANELEQEKELELQELGKGIDKASRVLGRGLKTEKRGCFGGLFGGWISKVI
jgi:hypothetical protein